MLSETCHYYEIVWAKDSTDLYSSLAQYYKSVSEKNKLYEDHSRQLDGLIARLDFDGIWGFIVMFWITLWKTNEIQY